MADDRGFSSVVHATSAVRRTVRLLPCAAALVEINNVEKGEQLDYKEGKADRDGDAVL
jgi:hypothetical protein